MRWSYGSYQFPENTVRSAARLENTHNDDGSISQAKWSVTLRGVLMGTSAANILSQTVAMQAALEVQRQNLVLRSDDGAVLMSLTNTASVSGVLVKGLRWPEGTDGFEFVSGRTFEVDFEVTYGAAPQSGGVQLLQFEETVETSGGGPVIGFARPLNAEPRAVVLYTHSPYEAVQSGQASSLLGYWPVPPPVLGTPIELPRVSRRCAGTTFTVSWSYRYQGPRPFVGLPTRV